MGLLDGNGIENVPQTVNVLKEVFGTEITDIGSEVSKSVNDRVM